MYPQNGSDKLQLKLRLPKRIVSRLLPLLLAVSMAAPAVSTAAGPLTALSVQAATVQSAQSIHSAASASSPASLKNRQDPPTVRSAVTYASLKPPAYANKPSVALNKNKPRFTAAQLKVRREYEKYSALDQYGRAQAAMACLGKKTLPTAKRGSIGMVRPAGFRTTKYDFIDGKYLYNRCHLIAYELSAENANARNLTTGTRYMNIKGMLPYENKVAAFIRKTGRHVLYRTTPIYRGSELLPRGVTIEARSLEDNGKGISFYVYCYNVQPGVKINYRDGSSSATGSVTPSKAGWKKVNGKWYYYKSDGKTVVKSSWLKLNGRVYYVDKNGVRVSGWQTIGGKKHYFDASGVMATGWKTLSGKKYWFDSKGAMATGWKTLSGKKYWFDSKGVMASGKRTIGGKPYTFDANGALKSGSGNSSGTGSGSNVTAAYIGNKNTKKFHRAGCSSVGMMSDSNKVGFQSRSAAVSAGYAPCKNCNP